MGFQISLIVKWFNIQDDLGPLRWPPPLLLLLFGRLGFSGFSCYCGANILRIIVRISVKHATEIVRIRTIIGLGFSFCCDYGCVAHSQTFNCNELGLGAGIESLDVVVVSYDAAAATAGGCPPQHPTLQRLGTRARILRGACATTTALTAT